MKYFVVAGMMVGCSSAGVPTSPTSVSVDDPALHTQALAAGQPPTEPLPEGSICNADAECSSGCCAASSGLCVNINVELACRVRTN